MSGVQYGQVITSVYLKVSVSDFLTLFSARTSHMFFFRVAPAPILFTGGMIALTASSLISIFWPESTPDDIPTEGLKSDIGLFVFVWIYCLFWWFVQDIAKVYAYKVMYATNMFNINGSNVVALPESAKALMAEFDQALAEGTGGTGHH
jgi:H+-transporting ATPase